MLVVFRCACDCFADAAPWRCCSAVVVEIVAISCSSTFHSLAGSYVDEAVFQAQQKHKSSPPPLLWTLTLGSQSGNRIACADNAICCCVTVFCYRRC